MELSYSEGVEDVWGASAKLTTSFKHTKSKTTAGSTKQVISNTEKLIIGPSDSFATLIVVRTKRFNNAEVETTYRVVDMDFSGERISFPKEELTPNPDAVFTTRSRLSATFADGAYAQVKIEGNMTDEEILAKAIQQVGWGD